MTKRVLILNEGGTAEVNGVKVRVVPVEPTETMLCAAESSIVHGERDMYRAMLSAVTIDLSGLPVVPRRKQLGDEAVHGDRYRRAWGWNQALDAIGAGK